MFLVNFQVKLILFMIMVGFSFNLIYLHRMGPGFYTTLYHLRIYEKNEATSNQPWHNITVKAMITVVIPICSCSLYYCHHQSCRRR